MKEIEAVQTVLQEIPSQSKTSLADVIKPLTGCKKRFCITHRSLQRAADEERHVEKKIEEARAGSNI